MRLLKRSSNNKSGFTLVELIIASTMVIFIILSETAVYIGAVRTMRQSLWRCFAQNEVNTTIAHMSRELRAGYSVTVVSTSEVEVTVDTSSDPSTKSLVTREYRLVGSVLRYTPNTSAASTYIDIAQDIDNFNVSLSGRTLTVNLRCVTRGQTFGVRNQISLRCMVAGST